MCAFVCMHVNKGTLICVIVIKHSISTMAAMVEEVRMWGGKEVILKTHPVLGHAIDLIPEVVVISIKSCIANSKDMTDPRNAGFKEGSLLTFHGSYLDDPLCL